jgi:hypothetical protein
VDVRPLADVLIPEWDAFVEQSPDAWFLHHSAYIAFAMELGEPRQVENHSFFIVENGEILAVCPLLIEVVGDSKQFSYLGEFLPVAALAPGLTSSKSRKVMKYYVDVLTRVAAEHDVDYVRIMAPALAPSRVDMTMPSIDPLLRLGYLDVSGATQLIHLESTEEDLWGRVRSGHRQDIKKAEALCELHMWHGAGVADDKCREYQELHQKDAGRATRSQRSFDLMFDWVRRDRAVLVEASSEGVAIAFSLFIVFGTGAYYASSCKDPDHSRIPASHLIQWRTMLWLKGRGYRHYDLGPQHFAASLVHVPSAKDLGISSFKRGFGGSTVRVPFSEFFYSTAFLEGRLDERRRDYLMSRESGR